MPEATEIGFTGGPEVELGEKPPRRRALQDIEAKPNVSTLNDRRKWNSQR